MAIGVNLQKLMSSWNIRGMMMVSLGVQIVLAFAAPYRRNSAGSLTAIVVWSAYLLSDWTAIYAFGLISNSIRASSVTPSEVNQDVLALWASFLLIHMGGPDTITAYSFEDNSLWLRHLIRLVGQLAVFSYIFFKTFPGNNLVVLTVLILATGVLKYGERIRALFLASLDNLKGSIGKPLASSLNLGLQTFTGLIVDVMPSPSDLEKSRKSYEKIDAGRALVFISRDLKLIYEGVFTKVNAVFSRWGIYSRCVVYVNIIAALVLFCRSSKNQFDAVDVRITYCLLVGTFIIDMSRSKMDMESSSLATSIGICSCCLDLVLKILTFIPTIVLYILSYRSDKLWSKKVGRFNLLDCSIQKYCHSRRKQQDGQTTFFDQVIDRCGLTDRVDKMKYAGWNDFKEELWGFIFDGLRRKAMNIMNEEQAREVFESKGEFVLGEMDRGELKKEYVEDFDYDKSVLCWHIATEICYNNDEDKSDGHREWSKTISDYLMYLLIYRPKLTATLIGISPERYAATCIEVKELAKQLGVVNLKDFCEKVLKDREKDEGASDPEKRGDENDLELQEESKAADDRGHDKSVLQDGRDLARMLMSSEDKWKTMAGVWGEMLSYAAGHCRGEAHVRTVSEGGELLTHVWLLMARLGISARWSKS